MNAFEDEYLTVTEVAERLKLNPQTVRNWIEQNKLPAVRVGRRVRIRLSDFDRLVQDGYSARAGQASAPRQQGTTGEDFWSGNATNIAQPAAVDPEQPQSDA